MPVPTFSILICNYNHGCYLPQCLAGIRRQTFADFEVLITDDGSTDASQQIIADAAAKDPRIKPHYFAKNQGAMAAVADIWGRATGSYIFGEGADDFMIDERFLERAAAGLAAHPDAAGFFGVAGLFSAGKNTVVGKIGSAARAGFVPPEECYRDILRGRMFVPGSSSIWRRDCLEEIGGYDLTLGPQIDFLVNHALPSRHGAVFADVAVTCQRIHENASNFGSKGGTLWESTGRLAKVEQRMREWARPYDGMEADWKLWRARWTLDAIRTSGVHINPPR
ncbi:MAG: glycosyltransferase [Opitutae bacterium]|nr:glycosyltransferase [Opitutae bacterium]